MNQPRLNVGVGVVVVVHVTRRRKFTASFLSGENMVYKCGKEITPHIPAIIKLCLSHICYDPNYNYDDAEEDEDMDCDGDDVRKICLLQWI